MPFEAEFGYLPIDVACEFDGGRIMSGTRYADSLTLVQRSAHPDGHLYPPIVETRSRGVAGDWEPVPRSRRGALMQSLPPTHILVIDDPSLGDPRLGEAALLLHLLAAMCGRRLQFAEWFVDGRVSIRGQADHYPPHARQLAPALGAALAQWRRWPLRPRQLAVNALYLHGRAMSLEFVWDQFVNQYLVADAAFRLVQQTTPGWSPSGGHRGRLGALCSLFGVPTEGSPLQTIVDARNELFHEAQWAGGMPGMADSDELWNACLSLQGLCLRILYGAFGLRGGYLSGSWWDRQMSHWDLCPAA